MSWQQEIRDNLERINELYKPEQRPYEGTGCYICGSCDGYWEDGTPCDACNRKEWEEYEQTSDDEKRNNV